MKKHLLLYGLVTIFAISSNAQSYPELSNNEFDDWQTDNYNPIGWGTVESAFGQHFDMTIKDTTDKVNGPASLKLVTAMLNGAVTRATASVGYTYYATNPHGIRIVGAPYTGRPDTLWVLYKYATSGADTAGVQMGLYANPQGNQIFSLQVFYALPPAGEWTLKAFKLSPRYQNTQMPDSILLNLFSSAKNANVTEGSTLQVDGIYFNAPGNNATGVATPQMPLSDLAIFPNPSSDNIIYLKSATKLDGYRFELHNISGNGVLRTKLKTAVHPEVNVSNLSTGTYLWLLIDKNDKIIQKGKWIKMD